MADRIDTRGTVDFVAAEGFELVASAVDVIAADTATPYFVTAADLASTPGLNGVLVSVDGLTLQAFDGDDWLMSDGITVGNHIIGTLPSFATGTQFARIRGIANLTGSTPVVRPRTAADIVQ